MIDANKNDEQHMRLAVEQAKIAAENGDVAIGRNIKLFSLTYVYDDYIL